MEGEQGLEYLLANAPYGGLEDMIAGTKVLTRPLRAKGA